MSTKSKRVRLLPSSAPVRGQAIDELRASLGFSTSDMCWLLGMRLNKWGQYVRAGASKVIDDQSIEILVRLIDSYPELSPIPAMPTMKEMFDLLEAVTANTNDPITRRELAILMGRQASGGHRWLERNASAPPALQHIAYIMKRRLDEAAYADQKLAVVLEWRKLVKEVAAARGVADIFKTGQWPKDPEPLAEGKEPPA